MRWELHGLVVAGETDDDRLRRRWRRAFAGRPATSAAVDLKVRLHLVSSVPAPPERAPDFRQGGLLRYYVTGDPRAPSSVLAHLPRYGRLRLDLAAGRTTGEIVAAALDTYGVLEDLLALALSPHLRRRGFYLLHAFAAASAGRAALLVGGIGAGKTTTGLALLDAGWQLLSNDSPIIAGDGRVLAYPGELTAYPDSLARIPSTAGLAGAAAAHADRRQKLALAAETLRPNIWLDAAAPGAILFLRVAGGEHQLTRLRPAAALVRLLPHAVEQWDQGQIAGHMAVLRRLVEAAPAYTLDLGTDIAVLPDLLAGALDG